MKILFTSHRFYPDSGALTALDFAKTLGFSSGSMVREQK